MTSDPNDRLPATTAAEPGSVVVPIGSQTLQVPPAVGSYLLDPSRESAARLSGTRVWIRRRHGELIVHIGDVEQDLESDSEQDG